MFWIHASRASATRGTAARRTVSPIGSGFVPCEAAGRKVALRLLARTNATMAIEAPLPRKAPVDPSPIPIRATPAAIRASAFAHQAQADEPVPAQTLERPRAESRAATRCRPWARQPRAVGHLLDPNETGDLSRGEQAHEGGHARGRDQPARPALSARPRRVRGRRDVLTWFAQLHLQRLSGEGQHEERRHERRQRAVLPGAPTPCEDDCQCKADHVRGHRCGSESRCARSGVRTGHRTCLALSMTGSVPSGTPATIASLRCPDGPYATPAPRHAPEPRRARSWGPRPRLPLPERCRPASSASCSTARCPAPR